MASTGLVSPSVSRSEVGSGRIGVRPGTVPRSVMNNRNVPSLEPDPGPPPDPSALRLLAQQHARSLDDFEEIQQELWLRVLQSPRRSHAEIRWLAAIARNISLEIRRGRHARVERERRYARERLVLTQGYAVESVDRELLVESLLRGLTRADQAILWRHFVDGLRVCELAVELGLTPAATKARLHRSVVRLRELRTGSASTAPDGAAVGPVGVVGPSGPVRPKGHAGSAAVAGAQARGGAVL